VKRLFEFIDFGGDIMPKVELEIKAQLEKDILEAFEEKLHEKCPDGFMNPMVRGEGIEPAIDQKTAILRWTRTRSRPEPVRPAPLSK
jgi:hypothetical protein